MILKAIKGMSFISLSILILKFLSLFAFYVVSLHLTEEQLGKYAVILGSVSLLMSFQNGAIEPLMINRKVHSRMLANQYLSFGLLVNVFLFFLGLTILLFRFNDFNMLFIGVTGLVYMLFSGGYLYLRTKYFEYSNFRAVTKIEIIVGFLQYSTLTILAITLESELAFAGSNVVLSIVGLGVLLNSFRLRKINIKFCYLIFSRSKWLMLGSFLSASTINLPYLVLSVVSSNHILGGFYFVNQLTFSISALLGKPIQSVMLPIITSESKSSLTQNFNYLVLLFGLSILCICTIVAFFSGTIVSYAWGGKWDYVIPIVTMSIVTVGVRLTSIFYWSFSQSKSLWSLKPKTMVIENIIFMAVVFFLGKSGEDILHIGGNIYLFLGLSSVASQVYMIHKLKISGYIISVFQTFVLLGFYFVYI